MRKIRDVLRLKTSGMSKRQIAASLSIGRRRREKLSAAPGARD
jgi:hypothetical protein